ncbi:YolD-like family protein [Cytobacillus depressus]|uniref:YolD-like family protein n=1 Tax=Cytobacillus depressus TaxID=1602942 RepID=A0A6L3V012_9BACI|nr:YolD-like family protein [Cytobacillus depressus]
MMESINYTLQVKITFWEDGYFKYYSGVVSKVD